MAFSELGLYFGESGRYHYACVHSGETAHRGTGGHEEVGEMAAGDLGTSA